MRWLWTVYQSYPIGSSIRPAALPETPERLRCHPRTTAFVFERFHSSSGFGTTNESETRFSSIFYERYASDRSDETSAFTIADHSRSSGFARERIHGWYWIKRIACNSDRTSANEAGNRQRCKCECTRFGKVALRFRRRFQSGRDGFGGNTKVEGRLLPRWFPT